MLDHPSVWKSFTLMRRAHPAHRWSLRRGPARLCPPQLGRHPAFDGRSRAADASLVSPLLTFNPAFTLLLAWPALGEVPGLRQTTGVAEVLLGSYLLHVEEARTGP